MFSMSVKAIPLVVSYWALKVDESENGIKIKDNVFNSEIRMNVIPSVKNVLLVWCVIVDYIIFKQLKKLK